MPPAEPRIINARIKSTQLHLVNGILCFNMTLEVQPGHKTMEWGRNQQLEYFDGEKGEAYATLLSGRLIGKILRVTEADSWETLSPQTYVRLKLSEKGNIIKLGHIVRDKWVSIKEEVYREKKVDDQVEPQPRAKAEKSKGYDFQQFVAWFGKPDDQANAQVRGSGNSSNTSGNTEAADYSIAPPP